MMTSHLIIQNLLTVLSHLATIQMVRETMR